MNKKRSTQILEILLLPYCGKEQQESLPFAQYFRSYALLLQEDSIGIAQIEKRKHLMQQFSKNKKKLVDFLVEKCTYRPSNLDDIFMLFELFFPKDDVLQRTCADIEDKLNDYYLFNLERIAGSLLTFRDGTAAIRTWKNPRHPEYGEDIFGLSNAFDKVEIWNHLSRMMTTDTLVAVFIILCGLDMTALYEQSSMISLSDKLLSKILRKGVAETHLHLNAGYDFQTIWEKNMDLYLWRKILEARKHLNQDDNNVLFTEAVIRMCMITFLNEVVQNCSCKAFAKYVQFELPQEIQSFTLTALTKLVSVDQDVEKNEKILSFFIPHSASLTQEDFLFQGVYKNYKELHAGSELIFLYQSFAYLKERPDACFRRLLLRYIRLKNYFYTKNAQRSGQQGLDLFQRYFSNARKAVLPADDVKALIQAGLHKHLNMSFLKKLEVRVAPKYEDGAAYSLEYEKVRTVLKQSLLKQVEQILSAYRILILERLVSVQYAETLAKKELQNGTYVSISQLKKECPVPFKEMHFPTLGIVFHFLKRESVDDIAGFFCWRGIEDDLVKYSDHRLVLRHKIANLARAIEELRSEIPYLHEYIVGIDAASNENAAEPWILSPAFRLIRTKQNVKPVLRKRCTQMMQYQKIANIGFTYHVGEDFRHPLSGLRHVSEVLEQFFYKSGDRLGHAIVLGMDVERWSRENEVVELKAREELENYLWIWGKMMYGGWDAPIQIKVLEGRILELAAEIYDIKQCQNLNNLNVAMLYKSYNLKFDIHHEELLKEYLRVDKTCNADMKWENGTFCKYSKDACPLSGYSFWNEKKLLCTQYCPVFERRGERVKLTNVSMSDVPLLQYIQDRLLDQIEQTGIFIETNPTSNLTIGEIQQMSSHPIFKLNALLDSPHAHHAMVTINADDPCIFHTDVENEIAYIYHALEHDGYRKEQILVWIDKVREYGLQSSFVSDVKDTETMLFEITTILNEIRAYLLF